MAVNKVAGFDEDCDVEKTFYKFYFFNVFQCNHFSNSCMSPRILDISVFTLVYPLLLFSAKTELPVLAYQVFEEDLIKKKWTFLVDTHGET